MARTRSENAHRKVLEAAVSLFAEDGIDATSMDAIARTSGVSKATIYKHWPDKEALCMEVFVYIHGLDQERPVFRSGDFRKDLIDGLSYQPGADRQPLKEKIWPHLIAYSARNQAFAAAWREKMTEPSRTGIIDMIKRGQSLGILKKDIDPEIGIAILLGPLLYRNIFIKQIAKRLPKNFEAHIADVFLTAFGTPETVRSIPSH
ncbi:MAG TPA: TetR/AcrR family transcriptional regulator [Edaphobacter sp.]|nr:TetR/AcrR family transcriptional regulator [Edaphobacter sp.]